MKNRENLLLVAGMIFIAAMTRLLPHYPNFTAVGALALFGGAVLKRKYLAFLIPLAALFISNLFLDNLIYAKMFPEHYQGFVLFDPDSVWIYGAFILIVFFGMRFLRTISPGRAIPVSILSSVCFFLITNFGVWAGSALYPKTMTGLLGCLGAGIPFFWNTLLGDLFYVALLFGAYEMITSRARQVETA